MNADKRTLTELQAGLALDGRQLADLDRVLRSVRRQVLASDAEEFDSAHIWDTVAGHVDQSANSTDGK